VGLHGAPNLTPRAPFDKHQVKLALRRSTPWRCRAANAAAAERFEWDAVTTGSDSSGREQEMIRRYLGVSALAIALAIGGAGLAGAQQQTAPPPADAAAATDDGFDWGWLGLLGLIGLAGLAGSRRRHEPVRTTTTGTTGTVR
jgi:MYXO-CTERM domain-containing protein